MRGHKNSYFSVIIKWALSKLDLVIAKKMSKYYEVAKILAVRSIDGHKEYRVRWKGFWSKVDTWVQEDDCNSAMKNASNEYPYVPICIPE